MVGVNGVMGQASRCPAGRRKTERQFIMRRSDCHAIDQNTAAFGRIRIVACLAPEQDACMSRQWHLAASGTCYLLEPAILGRWRLVTPYDGKPVVLTGPAAVADYVSGQARRYGSYHSRVAIDLLADAIHLAMYPGHIPAAYPARQRARILLALKDGLGAGDDRLAGRRLARLIYLAAYAWGTHAYAVQCLHGMPACVVGMLTAHGLIQPALWGGRYHDALVQGWRYQLIHPAECYADPDLDWDPLVATCMIMCAIDAGQRASLLRATGLTEQDVRLASEIAGIAGPPGSPDYLQALLTDLGARSSVCRMEDPIGQAVLPDDIGKEQGIFLPPD
jgi:hypothetical protein